jgi:hypothetical protein
MKRLGVTFAAGLALLHQECAKREFLGSLSYCLCFRLVGTDYLLVPDNDEFPVILFHQFLLVLQKILKFSFERLCHSGSHLEGNIVENGVTSTYRSSTHARMSIMEMPTMGGSNRSGPSPLHDLQTIARSEANTFGSWNGGAGVNANTLGSRFSGDLPNFIG